MEPLEIIVEQKRVEVDSLGCDLIFIDGITGRRLVSLVAFNPESRIPTDENNVPITLALLLYQAETIGKMIGGNVHLSYNGWVINPDRINGENLGYSQVVSYPDRDSLYSLLSNLGIDPKVPYINGFADVDSVRIDIKEGFPYVPMIDKSPESQA